MISIRRTCGSMGWITRMACTSTAPELGASTRFDWFLIHLADGIKTRCIMHPTFLSLPLVFFAQLALWHDGRSDVANGRENCLADECADEQDTEPGTSDRRCRVGPVGAQERWRTRSPKCVRVVKKESSSPCVLQLL